MSRIMKIVLTLIAVAFICATTEGKFLRFRRGTSDLQQSYIVHYNNKGQPLSVAGFEEFVHALNEQQTGLGMSLTSYAENPAFPPLRATSTTSTEPTTTHQPRLLATETLKTPGSTVIATASPKPAYVTVSSTVSPLKLPHEMSSPSPMAEDSVSTGKPKLTLALGHDAAATSVVPEGPSLSDVSNLVTPGENLPSKMTVSGLGFLHGTGSTNTKLISLQPAGVQTLLNYASPPLAIRDYFPAAQMSYVQALQPTVFQKPYAHSTQPEIFNYASYPSQNLAVDGNLQSVQIVRQAAPSLIDIGQGLGQGYRSAPQELAINLGGWGGIDYSGQRSVRLAKPVLGITKLGYTVPGSSAALSKIGFGPGSW